MLANFVKILILFKPPSKALKKKKKVKKERKRKERHILKSANSSFYGNSQYLDLISFFVAWDS